MLDPAPPTVATAPPESHAAALEVRGLRKRYGKVDVLRGLDLTVEPGEVYGFLGRNGAGKTTTIRILVGIARADAGAIRLQGALVHGAAVAQRRHIGYVAQEQSFYGWMTPATIGDFVRGFYPTWDDREYARLVTALDLPQRKIRTFSGGMKAKLALALALAHHPPLLILDEPTAGLDPVSRHEFLEMVRAEADRARRTTFFSSHILSEVEAVADRVGIIDDGRMRYEGGWRELAERVRILRLPAVDAELAPGTVPAPLLAPESGFQILQARLRRGQHEVVLRGPDAAAFDALLAQVSPWTLESLTLEEIFIEMVSRPVERLEAAVRVAPSPG